MLELVEYRQFVFLETKTTAMNTGVQMSFKTSFAGGCFFSVHSCNLRPCKYSLGTL